jgi:hypothetical protein
VISRIHQRLGTAGFVLSIVALVAALGGGAYAASGGLTGKQKKEVEKIAKKYSGKAGPVGASGPAGPVGPSGAKGDKGDSGANGSNGAPGTNGASGTSVTNTSVKATEAAKCEGHGGAEFKVGGGTPTYACNGVTGFTETLPPGKTETGTWTYAQGTPANTTFLAPTEIAISFPIPLSEGGQAFGFTQKQTTEEEFGSSGCSGTLAKPKAPPGVLCIYTGAEELEHAENVGPIVYSPSPQEEERYGPTGAVMWGFILQGTATEAGKASAYGTWAVTAATP